MKNLSFLLACFFVFLLRSSFAQSLVSIEPDTLRVGQRNVTAMVTGSNFFFTGASQSGNILNAYLLGPGHSSQIFDHRVAAPAATVAVQDTAFITFTVSPLFDAGFVDLLVRVNNPAVSGAVFVDTLFHALILTEPESRLRGQMVRDLNRNGANDFSDAVKPNETVALLEYGVHDSTDANGTFDFGVDNGSYSLMPYWGLRAWSIVGADTIQISVANDTIEHLDFLVTTGLKSISPAVLYRGSTNNNIILTSDSIFPVSGFMHFYLHQGVVSYPSNSLLGYLQFHSLDSCQLINNVPTFTQDGIYDLWLPYPYRNPFTNGYAYYMLDAALEIRTLPYDLSGTCYFDQNANGLYDAGERGIPRCAIELVGEGISAFSSASGNYLTQIDTGTHQVACRPDLAILYVVTTNPPVYSIANTGSVANVDFGLRATAADYTTSFELTLGPSRCNANSTHTVTLMNRSNVVSQGSLTIVKHPTQSFVGFSPPIATVAGDSATWNFSGLLPLSTSQFRYTVLNPPPSQITNSVLVQVLDSAGNHVISDGTTYPIQVLCSCDPNDKSVLPVGVDSVDHYTLFSDTLDYLIRFQNTGNDTALNVFIRDTLDASLDLSTLTLVASSHNVSMAVDSARAATFLFENIMLPDSIVDEPGSHGFVRYRVKALQGLPEKTRVTNTCFIYFDLNVPVQTNTVWNSMVSVINTGMEIPQLKQGEALFYPNPMQHTAWILFRNDAAEEAVLSVFNLNGQLLEKIHTNSDRFELSRGAKTSGLYQYIIDRPTSGKRLQGRFIVE